MTTQPSAGRGIGDEPRPAEHRLTDEHWRLAAEAVTTGGTEFGVVVRVAQAIADAEDRVRFGSAYCPDCGVHVDNGPHDDECPHAQPEPCSVCLGAGTWQQPDGSINECPRGCATGGEA